ncbi:DegV family protein, partial [Microbacterium sp. Bi128]
MPHREPSGWPWLRERLVRLRQGSRDSIPEAAPAAVVQVAVVTDSAAALPADWVRAFAADGRLTVVPMPVMVGAEIYGEGEDDIAETIAVALASGKPVKTSRPSPGQFEHAYREASERGFQSVVSIHISAGLSGT